MHYRKAYILKISSHNMLHITQKEFFTFANHFLEVAEQTQIRSFQDVHDLVGRKFIYQNTVEEYLTVEQAVPKIKNLYNPLVMKYVVSRNNSFHTAFELHIYEESKEIDITVTMRYPLKGYISLNTPEMNNGTFINVCRFHMSDWSKAQEILRAPPICA